MKTAVDYSFPKELTNAQLWIFMNIIWTLMTKGNCFTSTSGSRKTVAQRSGVGVSTVSNAISALLRRGVIRQVDGNSYMVDPHFSNKVTSEQQHALRSKWNKLTAKPVPVKKPELAVVK